MKSTIVALAMASSCNSVTVPTPVPTATVTAAPPTVPVQVDAGPVCDGSCSRARAQACENGQAMASAEHCFAMCQAAARYLTNPNLDHVARNATCNED